MNSSPDCKWCRAIYVFNVLSEAPSVEFFLNYIKCKIGSKRKQILFMFDCCSIEGVFCKYLTCQGVLYALAAWLVLWSENAKLLNNNQWRFVYTKRIHPGICKHIVSDTPVIWTLDFNLKWLLCYETMLSCLRSCSWPYFNQWANFFHSW